jgi:hypothetical protein
LGGGEMNIQKFKIFEQKKVVDPYGEEDWNDEYSIYQIGIGRDFDVVGYLCARSEDEAKNKAIEENMVPDGLERFTRVHKYEKVSNVPVSREKSKYELSKYRYESLLKSVEFMKNKEKK